MRHLRPWRRVVRLVGAARAGLAYDAATMLAFSNTGLLELRDDSGGWVVTRVHAGALGGPAVSSRGADNSFE